MLTTVASTTTITCATPTTARISQRREYAGSAAVIQRSWGLLQNARQPGLIDPETVSDRVHSPSIERSAVSLISVGFCTATGSGTVWVVMDARLFGLAMCA